jgi:hypothetical protein
MKVVGSVVFARTAASPVSESRSTRRQANAHADSRERHPFFFGFWFLVSQFSAW